MASLSINCCRSPDCQDEHCPGHPLLHQQNGGHFFNGGVVFPIEGEQQDQPVTTPEACEGWITRIAEFVLTVTAVGCLYMASRLFFCLLPFFNC